MAKANNSNNSGKGAMPAATEPITVWAVLYHNGVKAVVKPNPMSVEVPPGCSFEKLAEAFDDKSVTRRHDIKWTTKGRFYHPEHVDPFDNDDEEDALAFEGGDIVLADLKTGDGKRGRPPPLIYNVVVDAGSKKRKAHSQPDGAPTTTKSQRTASALSPHDVSVSDREDGLQQRPWWTIFDGPAGRSVTGGAWTRNTRATDWLTSLLQGESFEVEVEDDERRSEPRSEPLHVWNLEGWLMDNEGSSELPDTTLVMTPQARVYYDSIATYAQKLILAIGSPGQGKSRGLAYLILRLIRNAQAAGIGTVIFLEARKDARYFVLAPVVQGDPSAYEVFSLSRKDVAGVLSITSNPDNVHIVDMNQAGSGEPPTVSEARMIVCCSPDPNHFSELSKSLSKFHYPPWTEAQIAAARPHMRVIYDGSEVSAATVLARIEEVGPSPRWVFASPRAYEERVTPMRKLQSGGDISQIINTILTGGSLVLASGEMQRTQATLFLMVSSQKDLFAEPQYVFASRMITKVLCKAQLAFSLRRLSGLTDVNRALHAPLLGWAFERAVFLLMASGCTLDAEVWPHGATGPHSVVRLRMIKGAAIEETPPWTDVFDRIAASELLPATGVPTALRVIGSNCPSIDAADARNRVYQITVAAEKKAVTKDIHKLVVGRTATSPLDFVFVVPEGFPFRMPIVGSSAAESSRIRRLLVRVPLDEKSAVWRDVLAGEEEAFKLLMARATNEVLTSPPPGVAGPAGV